MKESSTETKQQSVNVTTNKFEDLPTQIDDQKTNEFEASKMMVVPRIVRVEWNPSGVMARGQDEPLVKVETLPLSRDENDDDDDIEIIEFKNEMFSSDTRNLNHRLLLGRRVWNPQHG